MVSPNLSEIVTTTLRNRTGELADNMLDNNALLNRLKKRGNVMPVDGGRTIVQELEYAENSTFKRYSGYETLNIAPSDVFTAAEFDFKQAAVAISISGLEELQNSGSEQIINLLAKRIKNAQKTMMNNISSDIYSDGTADGGKQIGGLQLLVSKTPTSGTVGGIDRSAYDFWQNEATVSGTAASATNIQERMNAMCLDLNRGTDGTDLIVADANYFGFYLSSLQAIQRISDPSMGGAGFKTLKFYGGGGDVDVVLDGGKGGNCPADTMYFLNTDYIHYRPHSKRNMTPIGNDRYATNQDAMVKLIGFAGNMTLSNASLQGVLSE